LNITVSACHFPDYLAPFVAYTTKPPHSLSPASTDPEVLEELQKTLVGERKSVKDTSRKKKL
jgi:hypothetical protein